MDKQDIKEKLIFLAITFCIFLPVRLLFYNFVSDWWVGSFGAITLVMILMLFLTKHNKLGYLGRIWKKQILKISKGKLGIIIIIQSIFFITMFSSIVWLTDVNRNTVETSELKDEIAKKGIDDLQSMGSALAFQDWRILLLPETWVQMYIFYSENPQKVGQLYAVIDDFSYGFHQHLNIVWLVEELETLAFVLYFRYFYHKKKIQVE